jgi:hypothetical protein
MLSRQSLSNLATLPSRLSHQSLFLATYSSNLALYISHPSLNLATHPSILATHLSNLATHPTLLSHPSLYLPCVFEQGSECGLFSWPPVFIRKFAPTPEPVGPAAKNEYFCRDELQQQAAQTSPNCRLQEPALRLFK